MRLRNINPLGAVEVPLLGRVLEAGEEFDIDDEQGAALLDQVGNYETVTPATPDKSDSDKPKRSAR
jgi:hypothetical protein